jgi:hypothetical protein
MDSLVTVWQIVLEAQTSSYCESKKDAACDTAEPPDGK